MDISLSVKNIDSFSGLAGLRSGLDEGILIVAGQSNAIEGQANSTGEYLESIPQVRYYQPSTGDLITATDDVMEFVGGTASVNNVGPAVTIAQEFYKGLQIPLVIVYVAEGGSGFSNNKWNQGDTNYNSLLTYCAAAKAALTTEGKTSAIVGMAWIQGEVEEANSNYLTQLSNFFDDLETDLADEGFSSTTPVCGVSPTVYWSTDGDYGHLAVRQIESDYFLNQRSYSWYEQAQRDWANNADDFGNSDTTHFSYRTHVQKLGPAVGRGLLRAISQSSRSGKRVAPYTVYNLTSANNGGTLEVYGYKTQGGAFLNPWFLNGSLTTYEWDICVADDENRTNEIVLATVTDSGSDHHGTYSLPAADNKYYYGILRGSYTYGTIVKTSEFVAQTKYQNV